MVFSVQVDGGRVLLVARDGEESGQFQIDPADARVLAADLYGASAVADPAGHQAMLDKAARGLVADALLAGVPTKGAH